MSEQIIPASDHARAEYEEAFTLEEKAVVEDCIGRGIFDSVVSALESKGFGTLNPEREVALDAYLKVRKPVVLDENSPTREAIEQMGLKGERIETPEQEAELQAKLDAEKAAAEAAARGEVVPEASEVVAEPEIVPEAVVEAPVEAVSVPVEEVALAEPEPPTSEEYEPEDPAEAVASESGELKTAQDYRDALTKLGVEFKSYAPKKDLIALYENTMAAAKDATIVDTTTDGINEQLNVASGATE